MPGTYRPERLAAIAQGAAKKVRGRVIRWLRDVGDERFFHVEAEVVLLGGRKATVRLQVVLPEWQPSSLRTAHQSRQRLAGPEALC